ncbi:MAG: PSD1 and planctomycete cytochrome C domain-containing protein [Planctomycetota bacterium]
MLFLRKLRLGIAFGGVLAAAMVSTGLKSEEPAAKAQKSAAAKLVGVVDYQVDVKPLLSKRCGACHGALQQKNGLRLDTAAAMRVGGESGPAIVPGKPADSLLIQAATGEAGFRMPPAGDGTPLTVAEIGVLRRWIAEGATAPADEKPPESPAEYWSYRAPTRPSLPPQLSLEEHSDFRRWVRDPVDAFIRTEHVRLGLTARPAAEPAVWLRRVMLDLTGIPPTVEELREFSADERPDASERVVDRLLARPTHGERWGRHWMDVWRYSDWYGSRNINEIRYSQRHIWRWRDWIVRSLNHDRPYTRMVEEMLAGDEVAPSDPETLAATGFLGRNWYKFDRNVWMFETIEQTSQAFLAATFKCARCHDHKFDPLTQDDYYRFRAVFEPHDVRTDRLGADGETEKDATLGPVLKVGVARIYDKQLDVPTYVFQRGDSRYPDEKRRMEPQVPSVFGVGGLQVAPIALPAEAFYPALRPVVAEGLIAEAASRIATAESELAKLRSTAAAARAAATQAEAATANTGVSNTSATNTSATFTPFYSTRFAAAEPAVWNVLSGNWRWENSKLTQTQVTTFATMVLRKTLPEQCVIKLRYRPLAGGKIRSIGFSFDYVDNGQSQDVYTSTGDDRQTIQAFHRIQGQQVYPSAGIVPVMLKVGQEAVIEAQVRGQQLLLKLDGEQRLAYTMPTPRRSGQFALWVHDGAAEFLELEIAPIARTLEDVRREARMADHAVALQEKKIVSARAAAVALKARLAAERAKFTASATENERSALIQAASRAHHSVMLAQREEELLAAEHALAETRLPENEKKVAAARLSVEQARVLRDSPDGKYEPLGEPYPATSTGRRLALARWLANSRHPRTSRVAANHVWLRHFGQALVPSVANFGLNGDRPSHPELLDWLATELSRSDWEMKPLHRRLVLSATYRMSSQEGGDAVAETARRVDPENRFLWRMNSRRMEAEAVRDSVLAAADLLDFRQGGPEIPEGQGQTVYRRSLYFRLTPNEKMRFLESFDAADPNACYRRRESVVPQQALVLMNSPLAIDAARTLADDIATEIDSNSVLAGDTEPVLESGSELATVGRITRAFERVLGRRPTAAEIRECRDFLAEQSKAASQPAGPVFPPGMPIRRPPAADPAQRAFEDLVHVLYNHNEFVTIR